jgi:ACS family tartrate transporter-like MFS transporter
MLVQNQDDQAYDQLIRKVTLRLLPFMFVLYIISYLDRINISFAGTPMRADLHFNEEVFGFGAGIFFFGYCLFGIPSNLALQKIGARKWISFIMVVWGFVSVFMAFVPNTPSFFAMRFLLGVAESGFFPGMIFYLTKWFRKREHGMAVAKFMSAIPVAGILGGLIASKILGMPPLMGLPPWKWLFIITGSPAIILGLVVLFYLPDGPEDAKWLSKEEKLLLESRLSLDSAGKGKTPTRKELVATLLDKKVWVLALLYFSLTLGMYGFQLWLPQIISATAHGDDSQTALLSAIPAIFQALGMLLIAGNSDRTGERRWHLATSALLAVVGLVTASVVQNPAVALAGLCLTALGIWGTVGPFWALPTAFLNGAAAAAAIALINSIGNLGGFAGPYIVGAIKQHSPNFTASLLFMAGSLLFGAILAVSIPKTKVAVE